MHYHISSKAAIQNCCLIKKEQLPSVTEGKKASKNFFLMTSDIGVKHFYNVAKNKTVSGFSPKGKRGKHEPANKISVRVSVCESTHSVLSRVY
jgi:hypothetical protein